MKRFGIIFSCLVLSLLFACKPDPVEPDTPDDPGQDTTIVNHRGVLIINEGTFTYANSSLTFYDPLADTVENYVFLNANGATLGDVGESMCVLDGQLYIVVNNSNLIYKANAYNFKCDLNGAYMMTGFYSPRFMHPVSSTKAYVSDIVGTELWIINPQTMTHTGSIPMGKSTETMVQVGQELYVANWSKYYVQDMENNTVQVVDINNDTKIADITVGIEPNGMVVDRNGKIWVLCEGAVWTEDAEDPTLWRIDPETKQAECMVTFDKNNYDNPHELAIDPSGTLLYYFRNGDVHRVNIDTPSEEDDSFMIPNEGRLFYKIAVDPWEGDVYVTDARNYVMEGAVYRYSDDGVLKFTFDAGIIPAYMLFY
ncbi:MAG: SMP-30/gluconolactonase/LRE family protein [Bacteroidales bacterium]|nr:SMP-30/gluconolactonase/LRE family protein [Bacteroidales bacterium]